MSAQRVLILSSQTLFAESLVLLLEDHGYEVIGVQPFNEAALTRVGTEQPSVVILDAHAAPPSAASALLECATNIRVLQVSLDSTTIAAYEHLESGANVHDFLHLVGISDGLAPGASFRGRIADGESELNERDEVLRSAY